MTDQPDRPDQEPASDTPAPGRILITFAAPRSADCQITTEGPVTSGQLMVAAWWLDQWLRSELGKGAQSPRGLVLPDHLAPGGLRRQ